MVILLLIKVLGAKGRFKDWKMGSVKGGMSQADKRKRNAQREDEGIHIGKAENGGM